MSDIQKKTTLKAILNGSITELLPKTNGEQVYLNEETTLSPKIAEMVSAINLRAKTADVNSQLNDIVNESNANISELTTNIDASLEDINAELALKETISDSNAKITALNESLSASISTETTRATNAESALNDELTEKISSETTRATAAEKEISDTLASEIEKTTKYVDDIVGDIPIDEKMDKENPTGTGSFSLNRKSGTTIGNYSFAEGYQAIATGDYSHAEGQSTGAIGKWSHTEGYSTSATNEASHAEGYNTSASAKYSHAEGQVSRASGVNSHAEGYNTTASGSASHAEGYKTTASGNYAHAEGYTTTASGLCSHAEGYGTIAKLHQHVQGKYNVEDADESVYAHIVGGGTSSTDRKNIHTIDWSGNAKFAGDITDGSGNILSAIATELETKETIQNSNSKIAELNNSLTTSINNEVTRAKAAEKANTDAITAETTRATTEEASISNSLSAEVIRAKEAEATNADAIANEVTRATEAESSLTSNLSAEVTRAQAAEKELSDNLSAEVTRAQTAEKELSDSLSAEVTRAINAEIAETTRAKTVEQTLTDNLSAEITRAKTAEKTNTDAIAAETTRATNAESALATDLSAEITRAKAAESALATDLSAEITRAKAAEKANADAIDAEVSRATDAESTLTSELSAEVTRAKTAENSLESNKLDKTAVAKADTLGSIKSGTDITVDAYGNVSVNDDSHKHTVSTISDLTASASEINVLDGITTTTAELNRLSGVTSNIQAQLDGKSADDHLHDDRYYTETEMDSKLSTKAPLASPTLTGTPKAPTADAGTNTTQIATTAFTQTAVANHNASETAHTDIRDLITDLTNRLNTLADSDDTTLDQLSEVVAYIKDNRSLIESVTTDKINVTDIVDVLTSTATDKPLSANQGKVLNDLITALTAVVNTKVDSASGDAHVSATKSGTSISVSHNNVTRTNSTSTENPSHGGTFTAVKSVTSDAKGHVTGVDTETVTLPTYGDASTTSKGLMTTDQATKLNGIATGAEVNQNAFSNVVVGSTTVAADSKTDTLTLVAGTNVTITPDATNDKITIASKDTVYTHPSYTAKDSGLYKVTVDETGHVSAATAVTKADITALGIPASDTNTHYESGTVVNNSTTSTSNTSAALTNGNVYLNHIENGAVKNSHKITGSGATTVTTDASGNIVITSTDTNTTYSAGTGLSLSGTTFNHKNSVTAGTAQGDASKTLTFGGTFAIPTVAYDAQGHVTGKGTTTMTMPANPNTDTHYTTGLKVGASATATANAAATNGNVYLNVLDNTTVRDSHKIVGSGATTVTSDANGVITVSSTDTNTHYTSKNVVGGTTATSNTSSALTNGNVYLNSVENGAVTSSHNIKGSGATTVTTDTSGNIIISSTDTNTNTTYSAGTGLSLSGTTFNHSNSVTAGTAKGDSSKTLSFGGTFTIPTVTYDAQGHVTSTGTTTMTMPANPNTDTKNTAGSTDTSSKIFLVGATSQAANPQTYSDNQVYATNGQLDANAVRVAETVTMQYNSSTESLDFVFA